MLNSLKLYPLPDKFYLYGITLFFFLLGSHLLFNHWWIFIFFSLFLIDWKKALSVEFFLIVFFSLILFEAYYFDYRYLFGDPNWIMHIGTERGTASEIVMIPIAYLLGLSIKGISIENNLDDKKLFYLLYGFFIAYGLVIAYSYFTVPQLVVKIYTTRGGEYIERAITNLGMSVYYTTQGLHVHSGKLVSTIIAYYLSMLVIIIPFILFRFKQFKEREFSYQELLILAGLSIFSLFLAIQMGRRMAFLLLIIVFLSYGALLLWHTGRHYGLLRSLLVMAAVVLISVLGYFLLKDTFLAKRITGVFGDQRYNFWILGLKHMMLHPWGGADLVPIIKGHDPRAHNVWIDIGKSFGILAFTSIVVFYLLHIRYLFRILTSKNISSFMKNLILIISFGLLMNMMVEAIYHVEKPFFYYSLFFLGFLKYYADLSADTAQPTSSSLPTK